MNETRFHVFAGRNGRKAPTNGVIVSLILLAITTSLAPALANKPVIKAKDLADLETQMLLLWSPSGEAKDVTVGYSVKNHKISNTKLLSSSGNPQWDAECLEAVCSVGPVKSNNTQVLATPHTITFERKGLFPVRQAKDVITSLEKLPAGAPKILVHNIPLHVSQLYPEFFTLADLENQDNLITIEIGKGSDRQITQSAIDKIEKHYAVWADFFSQPKVTKSEIVGQSEILRKSAL
ncbi:MAG: hypothetical protein JSS83_16410 [Cyanobacteria bacterium SZAS LIN-3]|nr:hypothetical protein [Cyanobacteria bacterium SZAS LIN-3]